jgi:argininosuccinate lyase
MSKLWGGRFDKQTDRAVEQFTASIEVDARLWSADILASQAHARMLGHVGVLTKEESAVLIEGLTSVHEQLAQKKLVFQPDAEDVHSEIERLLTTQVGTVAGKLHTGRSRNDQVATATRLYLRTELDELLLDIKALQEWFLNSSQTHIDTIMPGLTHMQHAQPVSLAHHLMAYFWMLERDKQRLVDARARINQLPLGAAALAGTSFPLDRQAVAKDLGFDGICENSLDAVSDRDFIVEFLTSCSLIMTHLSRLAEELILWSTPEFGFIQLDDSVTTGSSIMPQKKNPDVAELIRGRVGRVTGALVGALTMLKALPLSYNRDLQEDKGFLFTGLDTSRSSLRLMGLMLATASFNKQRMANAVRGDTSNATDLADYLARKGMPFRQAHEVVGGIVKHCLGRNLIIEDLTAADLKQFNPLFEGDAVDCVQPHSVMSARQTDGGTSPRSVRQQIARAEQLLLV